MPEFNVNTTRFDPYKNCKFRVKFVDGQGDIAGISKVSGLRRKTEVIEHREGGDPNSSRKSPGRTTFDAITMERGVTHDIQFEQWANKVWNLPGNHTSPYKQEASLKDFRKDLFLEIYNEAGQLVLRYIIYRCWVSEYNALPDLDANSSAIAIQSIKIEHEGWERDQSVAEPAEFSFNNPDI